MAFYYTTNLTGTTSNGSGNTELDHIRWITGANTRSASFVQVIVSARLGTVGGATIRLAKFGTASTNQTAIVPVPKDPAAQASTITASTNPTAGSTRTNLMSIGFSQTGAQGFWGAAEPNDALLLQAAAGATGNMDAFSICTSGSVGFDMTTEHIE